MNTQLWPSDLGEPIFPLDNFRIAQAMSRLCNGTVPSFDEARRYAAEQAQDASDYRPQQFAERRG